MARGPIRYTCPSIDRQIKENDDAIKSLRRLIDEMEDQIRVMESNNEFLEEMRGSNDALRTWGAEQEDRAERLEEELEEAKKEISNY